MLQLTAQVAAVIAGDHDYCHLIRIELANSTIIRLTDAGFGVVWNGEVFDANGLLIGMDSPKFTSDIRVGEISLAFSAADQSLVALMLGTNQINRYVNVYRAFLNSQGQVIPDPVLLHTWLITSFDVSDNKKSPQISVSMASEWADFEKPAGRRSTDASQQRIYPGDKGMEFAGQVKKDLKWGGA